jgi:hypothetical protein
MFNPLTEPESWNDLFLSEKPMAKTSAFWTCLLALAYAAIVAGGLGIRLAAGKHAHPAYAYAIPALVILTGFLFYLGWRFLGFIESIRQVVSEVPREQAVIVLRAARAATRLFYSSMLGVGIALMIAKLLISSAGR